MTFKRRRQKKTDYVQRFGLLKSGKPRLVIRRTLNSMHVQLVVYNNMDKTELEINSSALKKYGWKGHGGNLPSAYLTGYLIGTMAKKKGFKEAIVDLGLQISASASTLFAVVVGAKDAGLSIPLGKEAIPTADRISGKHIAAYAQKIKNDQEKYKKQFSAYLKNGLNPEDLPKHFEEVKGKITAEAGK